MLQNYEQLADKIAQASGLSRQEIDMKVDAKCAKLSGLISKEGSAQIVASELGVSFDKEKMKVSELVTGMKRVNVTAKVIQEPRINNFTTKSGVDSKVASFTIADDTGNIRTVLWDTNHIELFENGKLKNDNVVEISNASIRNDELHLGSFSDIRLSNENIENVVTEKKMMEKNILDLRPGENVKLRAIVAQIFEPRFFEVCPECNRKAVDSKCETHGNIMPVKRALLGVVLDDGSENMRAVMFSEQINNFGISDEELNNAELFMQKKNELLGQEMFFVCNVRNNKLFNTTELIINDFEQVELDSLIESLK